MVRCKYPSCGRSLVKIGSIKDRAGQHCQKKYGSFPQDQIDHKNPKDESAELEILKFLQFGNVKIIPTSERNVDRTFKRYVKRGYTKYPFDDYDTSNFDDLKQVIQKNGGPQLAIVYDIDLNSEQTDLRIKLLIPKSVLVEAQ